MAACVAALSALSLSALGCLLVACVDGQTPDCSDAATGCGPDTDGAVLDTGTDAEAGTEAGTDAGPADAPADTTKDSPADAPVDTGADVGDAKAG